MRHEIEHDKLGLDEHIIDLIQKNAPRGGGGGARSLSFLNLTDTPENYIGNAGKFVKVNNTEDGLEFIAGEGVSASWGDITGTLSNQTDLQEALDLKANIADLSTVATSNSYNDLDDLPTIPTKTSDLTNDSGFITDISGQDLSTADNSTSQFITQGDIDWATNVPLNETDPVYSANSYAVGMNQDVDTTATPSFADITLTDNVFGTPTYKTVGDFINIMSPGLYTKPIITDNGDGTVAVGAFSGMVQVLNADTATNKFFDFAGDASVSLTDDNLNYIYFDYNGGSPIISSTTSFENINGNTQFCIGLAYLRGTLAEILSDGVYLPNFRDSEWHRLESRGIERMYGGNVVETGTRYITVTAGQYYKNYTEVNTDAIDTSGADTFTYVYRDGGTGWTFDDNGGAGWQQVSNILYDDGDGTPGNVDTAKYAIYWVYQCLEGDIYIQMGQSATNNLVQAQTKQPPTPPNYLAQFATLIAKIIVLNGATNFTEVQNTSDIKFTTQTPSEHNYLTGLQGGTSNQYYHLTSAEYTVVQNTSGTNTGDQDLSGLATKELDNLGTTAINTSLISDTDSTDNLGSSDKYWANAYLDKIYLDSDSTIEASDVDGWNALVSFPGFTDLSTDYGFTDNSSNWDTAYGWGDHSSAGYALSSSLGAVATSNSYNDLDDLPSLVTAFTGLSDTPANYTDQAGKGLRVNVGEDGLEFYEIVDTDEKVKYDAGDPTAGYVADKIVAGTGISVAEGTGANENKLVITNDDKGSDVDLSGLVAKSTFDAHTILYATTDNTPLALEVAEQKLVGRLTDGNISAVSIGIADDNIIQIDQDGVVDNDYAKFTANGLEGRSYSEVKSDLSLDNVENTALSTWAGSANITTVGTLSSGNADAAVTNASTTAKGKVELATATETTTGTDETRAVTPDGLAGSNYGKRVVSIAVTDPAGDALTTGDGKAYIRIPSTINGWNLIGIEGHVTTASSSGNPSIALYNVTDSQDMLSVNLTIDANEKDSSTAETPPTINTSYDDVATGDELRIDIDGAGTGAKGLIIDLIFQLP